MAGDLRRLWRDFKRDHPAFEKSKNFKSDVGPQLDKFEQAQAQCFQMADKLQLKCREMAKLGNSVAAALKGYEAVIKELDATDRTIRRDFKHYGFDRVNDYVKELQDEISSRVTG
jgi:hypothetical protein